jgi:hypothetical protein
MRDDFLLFADDTSVTVSTESFIDFATPANQVLAPMI